MTNILIISPDLNPNQSLRQTLEANGFFADIQALSLEYTTAAISQRNPDLIVIDLSKAMGKAPEICRAVRTVNAAPMVVLSTVRDPELVAKVLDAGADDYLVKPVSNQILIASISKLTRRIPPGQKNLPVANRANLS